MQDIDRFSLSGEMFLKCKEERCIYGWFKRNGSCLYIGQSVRGITRLLDNGHHVIGVVEKVLPSDFFLYVAVPKEANLLLWEQAFIDQYNPKYNQIKYDYGKRSKYYYKNYSAAMPKLPRKVRPKKDLAKILFCEVPERLLLETPQDCGGDPGEQVPLMEKRLFDEARLAHVLLGRV